jgi:hypothetical protein
MERFDFFASKTLAQKKRIIVGIRLILVFGVCGLCTFTASWLSYRESLSVHTIHVEGDQVVDSQKVSDLVTKTLEVPYVGLISKKNIFLVPRVQIQQIILSTFPRIKEVVVSVEKDVVIVRIKERIPEGLWCNTLPDASSTPACYFLDGDGFVFDHAPDFSGNAYFKYYGRVPFDAPIGSYYISSTTQFKELQAFVTEAKKLSISPLYIYSSDPKTFELYVYGGAKIIVDLDSINQASQRLGILLRSNNIIPRDGQSLNVEYIDLRFGNKLFYKEKGAAQ